MKRAVVLLSGGLDSATALAVCVREGFAAYALSFDYGQRHRVELEAARAVAESLGAREHKIAKIDLRIFGGSALTDDIAVPRHPERSEAESKDPEAGPTTRLAGSPSLALERSTEAVTTSGGATGSFDFAQDDGGGIAHREEIPITYVPARNTIFLSYALAWAEVLGAQDIFIGVNAVDYSGYPDCRPQFLAAFETLAALATKAGVEGSRTKIHAPLLQMSKAEIITRAAELGVDLSLTHSCYDPDAEGRACGECDSCRLRLKGFAEAGLADRIRYQNR